jgi:intein-encoded DNA endonuclease-like protein
MARVPGFCPEGEEVKKMEVNTTKMIRYGSLPQESRIRIYKYVLKLRKRGLSSNKIVEKVRQKYGVQISKTTIKNWLRGKHNPLHDRRIRSLELKPSPELAYVIGVVLGDAFTSAKRYIRKGIMYTIALKAKDKEFVEEFARCIAIVLNRPPNKIRYERSTGQYIVEAKSKPLYELLRKSANLKKLRKYIEHCKKCMAAFLRGFFDSEGSVSKYGYITLCNSNYGLLKYVQRLLKRFGIESTGPWPRKVKGKPMHDPRTGKQYPRNTDCYEIYIRASSNADFYRCIGFTIQRKRKRLEEYLMAN